MNNAEYSFKRFFFCILLRVKKNLYVKHNKNASVCSLLIQQLVFWDYILINKINMSKFFYSTDLLLGQSRFCISH